VSAALRTGEMAAVPATRACRACAGTRLSPALHARGWSLERCADCGFVQVRDHPSDADFAAVYGDAYFGHSKYRDLDALNRENLRRLELLRRYVPKGAKVLDAGCATGDFVVAAKGEYEMWGSDLSAFAIEQARAKSPELAERLWAGKLEDFGGRVPPMDAICLWDVIEHVWDPVDVARRLLGHLKAGGYLLLSTPSIDAPIARAMGKYWAFMTPPEHLGFFSGRSFRRFFDAAVPGTIVHRSRRGKWANVAFIAYKLRRVAPKLMPEAVVDWLGRSALGKLALYVPTQDIQYLVVRKT
jgi:2-polyprenyl-3-methyl-5-hydroxy-6-metoxy-1,4-benzoquinol methylase